MNLFEKDFRTIWTRNLTLSKEQMETFRIKKIYNSAGAPDYLNDKDAEEILDKFISNGEFCLVEATNDGKIYKISLLTFQDIWSRNVFALMNMEYYKDFPDLVTLYN
jgi:hypothetical protein